MKLEFLELEEKILTLPKPHYYMPNPGNWGDALIHQGALKFFNSFGLSPKTYLPGQLPALLQAPSGSVIYGGGGAWCDNWNVGAMHVVQISKAHRVLVLPSTYEFLPQVDRSDNIYFMRDLDKSILNVPDAFFCHDMAFFLGDISVRPGSGVGHFFREDKESSGKIRLPKNNWDISSKGNARQGISGFFSAISQYAVIHTDRLHVSIACALMSRKCYLYAGNYFKNESVFMASIEPYSDCVKFMSTDFFNA